MKLNLLPTYVSKEKQSKSAWVISLLIAVGAIVFSVGLMTSSSKALADAQKAAEDVKPRAEEAVKVSNRADTIIAKAAPIIVNSQLAEAMLDHNEAYPKLFNSVQPYVPSFYRVTNMTATPTGPTSCTLTITGVLKSYQQYADLMVALLRIPNAKTISRSGFRGVDPTIPEISDVDRVGRPRKANDPPIPDDQLQRLQQDQANGTVTGYINQGGYGSGDPNQPRLAMPDYSVVTVTITLDPVNIQAAIPKGTLANSASSTPAGNATTAALPGAGVPAPSTAPVPDETKPAKKKGGLKNRDLSGDDEAGN